MSFLGLKENDLVIFVGSGTVAGAVVRTSRSSLPKIIHTHESPFPVKESVTSGTLSSHMLSALGTVTKKLHEKHKGHIRETHVVLSSPWFSSFSKKLEMRDKKPFSVSQKNIDKIVSDYVNSLSQNKENEDQIIEKVTSHVKINGYPTVNPIGKMAELVEVSLYAGLSPSDLKQKIEHQIYQTIHPVSISFHTLPFAAWSVINSLFSPHGDFIFVDIGSEVSDLLAVRQGSIESVVSIPLGKNHISRKISSSLDTHPELAGSIVNLYTNGALDLVYREKIKTLAGAFSEEWGVAFESALKDSRIENFLPQKSYSVASSAMSDLLGIVIKKQTPSLTVLSDKNLSQFVEIVKGAEVNIFVILASIYVAGILPHNKIVYKQPASFVR